ncbi:hypothetical protein [Acidimangrovimonas sediminis]|uniref:hypothetical protein n=1 Tax=Acidimangrovimonas sediminis TaxID=2056283 RepID=UPI0011AEE252|nr:hypothetical protein [Acidimangrovimonas sediminis]
MKKTVLMTGAAALGLAFAGSAFANQVVVPAQVLSCENCTAIEVPNPPAPPAERKIKVHRVWSTGVLH